MIKIIEKLLIKKTTARFRKSVFLLSTLLSTGCFVGKIKYAPGTFGSFFAILLCIPFIKTSIVFQIFFLGFLLTLGTISVHLYLVKLGNLKQDPKEVVIDEIVAIFFTAILCQFITPILDFQKLMAVFVLFRAFDVIKPYPISYIDKNIHGALGIMLDDILASIASFLVYVLIYA